MVIIVMRCCGLGGWPPRTDTEALLVTGDSEPEAGASAIDWDKARRTFSLAWERMTCNGGARMIDHYARTQLPILASVYPMSRWGQQVPKASLVKFQVPSKGKEESQTVGFGSQEHSS